MEFYNRIHCKFTKIKGFVRLYNDALRYRYMITEKAKYRIRVLTFWEKFGLEATMTAFQTKRRTLFFWKARFKKENKKIEALNDKSRTPQTKRKRIWDNRIIEELKIIRWQHPNLGKDKIYPLLNRFCQNLNLKSPQPSTIGLLIKDLGGLRLYPQKVRHNGQIIPLKRIKRLIKPKDLKAHYPGHLVALDTIERHVFGSRRYIITFEDIYTRFGFAWGTTSHASLAAKEFFEYCRKVFPFPIMFVLTDNGSEFMKHFADELKRLHLVHYHTYPKTPKMNAHLERFNRTIQEEFVDYHAHELLDVQRFNQKLIDWLIWYNTERVHYAFANKLSPTQFMFNLPRSTINKIPQECKIGLTYTQN